MKRPSTTHLTLLISLSLLPLVYMTVWIVLTGNFAPEVKSFVVGAVMSGALAAVTGFWLGASVATHPPGQDEVPK